MKDLTGQQLRRPAARVGAHHCGAQQSVPQPVFADAEWHEPDLLCTQIQMQGGRDF